MMKVDKREEIKSVMEVEYGGGGVMVRTYRFERGQSVFRHDWQLMTTPTDSKS